MAELNEILGNERIKEHFITAVHHKNAVKTNTENFTKP